MDKADYGIIFLGLLVGLVLLSFVTYEAYGFDTQTTFGSIWDIHPTICINETGQDLFYLVRATKAWEIELFKRTADDSFDYNIAVPDRGYNGLCHINASYEITGSAGTTRCLVVDETGVMLVCEVTVDRTLPNWYTTWTHEIGHALGLGHRIATFPSGFAQIILEDDIMLWQASPHDRISGINIDGLISFYGLDGFDGEVYIPKNYTVPHEEAQIGRRS